jgi:tetratricopeptide (TPR) repeat protein
LAQPEPAILRRLFEESLAKREKQFGPADARTAQAARDLGNFLVTLNDKAGARQALTEAVRIDDKALGPSAPQTLEDAAELASISPPAQAEPLLRRAIESADPIVAGPALTSLAQLRVAAGDRAGAASLLRRAVEKAEIADGKSGATVALVLDLLAQVAEVKEAIPVLQRAIEIHRQISGPRDAQTLADIRRLATLLRQAGRAAEAAQLEQQLNGGH